MAKFWILIFVSFFATNLLDKAESVKVKLEELPPQTFDELFVEEWWDKDEAEDLKMPPSTNFGQNVHHQIDRQNTQIGQIEPNSTDQNKNIAEDERKHKIVAKFQAIKDEFKQKGKFSKRERTQIEVKIAKDLKVNRTKIYKWKKEFGLSRITPENERKILIEKFDRRKAELKRDGMKNSYHNQINESVAKEVGLCFKTISNWKRKLGQSKPKHKHSHNEQKELMKRYYEIKDKTPKFIDKDIAKILKIGSATLYKLKKQFKRPQLHQHFVDFVEVNTGSNV